jgi:hypothetical protein
MKGICKNSVIPSKDQTHKSQALEKEKRCKPKGFHNIVNKIIAENFPNFKKEMPIQVQEASRTPNRLLHSILWLRQLAQRTKNEY